LALRAAQDRPGAETGFNFHPGARLGGAGGNAWRWGAAFAAVLVVGLGLNLGLELYLKNRRLESVRAETARILAQALPELRGRLTVGQQLSVLRGRLAEAGGSSGVVALLAGISSAATAPMALASLSLDGELVRLAGTSDGFGSVEKLAAALGRVPDIAEVRVRNVTAGGGGVSFQLELVRAGGGR
jgi:hypothetical protein